MNIIFKILNLIKKMFLFLVKEVASFFIKLSLLIIVIVLVSSYFAFNNKTKVYTASNYCMNIDLSNISKESKNNFGFLDENNINFYDFISTLRTIDKDSRVKVITVDVDSNTLSTAQIEELAKEFKRIQNEGIKIHSFMNFANNNNYLLASYGNSVNMPITRSASVNLYPYYKEEFYTKQLSDKLGIKYNVINIGDYKTFSENLVNEHMTRQNREELTRIYEKKYGYFLKEISENRKINPNKLMNMLDDGELIVSNSVKLFEENLIDTNMSIESFREEVKKEFKDIDFIDFIEYKNNFLSHIGSNNKIALLNLEGSIVEGKDIPHTISSSNIIDILEDLKKDEKIKGIVLRINSPGGSAFASNLISNKIKEIIKIKPVYVSMGSVSASGGYYISSNASKIFANANTITGSIGVISVIPNFSEMAQKLNVNIEEVKRGKYSDIYSMTKKFDESKYNKLKMANIEVYEEFLDEVSKGRKLDKNYLRSIADGRVWLGSEAKQIGLVDEIGGLLDTIMALVNELNIECEVVQIDTGIEYEKQIKKYKKNLNGGIKNMVKKEVISTVKEEFIIEEELFNKPITYTSQYLFDKEI